MTDYWAGVYKLIAKKRACHDVLNGHKTIEGFNVSGGNRGATPDEYYQYYMHLKGLIAKIEGGE